MNHLSDHFPIRYPRARLGLGPGVAEFTYSQFKYLIEKIEDTPEDLEIIRRSIIDPDAEIIEEGSTVTTGTQAIIRHLTDLSQLDISLIGRDIEGHVYSYFRQQWSIG